MFREKFYQRNYKRLNVATLRIGIGAEARFAQAPQHRLPLAQKPACGFTLA